MRGTAANRKKSTRFVPIALHPAGLRNAEAGHPQTQGYRDSDEEQSTTAAKPGRKKNPKCGQISCIQAVLFPDTWLSPSPCLRSHPFFPCAGSPCAAPRPLGATRTALLSASFVSGNSSGYVFSLCVRSEPYDSESVSLNLPPLSRSVISKRQSRSYPVEKMLHS